jgi:Phage integrase family.
MILLSSEKSENCSKINIMHTNEGSSQSAEGPFSSHETDTQSYTQPRDPNTQRKKKLTDARLQAILKNPPKERLDIQDPGTAGLELRVGPGGATWSLTLRVMGEGGVSKRGKKKKGPRYRFTLGEFPAISIGAARSLANDLIDQANRGISPARAMEAKATKGGLTVEGLGTKYVEDYVKTKELKSLTKYLGALNVHIVPELGPTLADVLDREQVRKLLKKVSVKQPRGTGARDRPRGGKEAARTVLGVLRAMIAWGIVEKHLTRSDNPCEKLENNLPKKRRGERVLADEEMQLAWVAAGTLGYPFGPVYRLLQVTANRRSNWGQAVRTWIDLVQALAVVPADHYKSDHVHVLPLVPAAVQIVDDVYLDFPRTDGPYIFSGTDGERPISGWSKAHERLLRAMCAISGEKSVKKFTPHDIRRTVATRAAELLGVGGEQLIKRVLGQSDGSVTAIYNRYGYVREMREVLEKLALLFMRYEPVILVSRPYVRSREDYVVPTWAANLVGSSTNIAR